MHRLRELVVAAAVCASACSSGAKPAAKPPDHAAATAPEASILNRTWIVDKHIMVKGSSLDESDAKGFHGRTVEVSDKGFVSPWQGTCESASRTLERTALDAIVTELGIKAADVATLRKFGFGDEVSEFRLQCNDREKPPPFLIYLSNDKAMTCARGACYLLILF